MASSSGSGSGGGASNAWVTSGNVASSGTLVMGVVSGTSTVQIDSAGGTVLSCGAGNSALFKGTVTLANGSLVVGAASTVTGAIQLLNSTNANSVTIQSGTTSAGYTMTLPTAAPSTNGSLLSSTTSGLLSWAAPGGDGWLVGGNTSSGSALILGVNSGTSVLNIASGGSHVLGFDSFGAASFYGTINATTGTINVGIASLNNGGITLSNVTDMNTVTIRSPSTVTATYTLTLPSAAPSGSGYYLTATTAGVCSWAAPSPSWLTAGNTSSGSALVVGVNSGTSTLGIYSAGGLALSFGAASSATFYGTINATTGTINIGTASLNNGAITLANVTDMNTVTIKSPSAVTATYILTLPPAAPSVSGYYLAATTAGVCSWSAGPTTVWKAATDTTVGSQTNIEYTTPSSNFFLAGNVSTTEGIGTRMMFQANAAAADAGSFRVGYTTGNQWNAVNRGLGSIGLGINSRASGSYSAALGGYDHSISGTYSACVGGSGGTISTAASYAVVLGGVNSTISTTGTSNANVIIGGLAAGISGNNVSYSTAIGSGAQISNSNAFVFSATPTIGTISTTDSGQYTATFGVPNGLFVKGLSGAAKLGLTGNAGFTVTQQANTTASYTVTWPPAQATAAGQVLANNGSGTLSWTSPSTGPGFSSSATGSWLGTGVVNISALSAVSQTITSFSFTTPSTGTWLVYVNYLASIYAVGNNLGIYTFVNSVYGAAGVSGIDQPNSTTRYTLQGSGLLCAGTSYPTGPVSIPASTTFVIRLDTYADYSGGPAQSYSISNGIPLAGGYAPSVSYVSAYCIPA